MVADADQRAVGRQLDRRCRARRRSRSRAARRGCGPGRCDGTRRAARGCRRPAATRSVASGRRGGRREALRGALDRRGRVAVVAATRPPSPARLSSSSSRDDLAPAGRPRRAPRRGPPAWTGRDGLGARLLQPQPQARQRRAQLVRGVGDELALRGQQRREPLGHLVERARELLLLGAALDPRAHAQVAARDALGRLVEAQDRPRDLPRDDRAGEQAERQDERADQRRSRARCGESPGSPRRRSA